MPHRQASAEHKRPRRAGDPKTTRRHAAPPDHRPEKAQHLARLPQPRYVCTMRALPVSLFALAAASPLALLALGATLGGVWPLLAVLYMSAAAVTLDLLAPRIAGTAPDREFPLADALLVALGCLALAALPLLTSAIASPGPLTPV
jgi:hypothetical protein